MIYGYARVSTASQKRDGNSLEAQESALKESGAATVYVDSFTGTKIHRPQFDKLMSEIADGDTLVVTKLDRMARSTLNGIEIVETLLARGVRVHILNMGILDNTPASKLMRTMFFAFAEFERDMIVERTTEGKAIARLRGNFKEGRPCIDENKVIALLPLVESGEMTVKAAAEKIGISRASWYNTIKRIS